jgi:type III pantothenate kinase
MAEAYFHRRVLVVSPDLDTGLRLCYTNPHELGTDRLVNAAAAYARYKTSLIIVDLGTATTFCAITQSGEYLGGVIAPGLGIAADALVSRTAQLPKVDLVAPKTVIGRDTVSSIQAGLIFGYTGLVDEIVSRMQAELGQPAMVIATGGLASFIAPESRTIREVRPFLTLEGLELLYRRTRGDD